MTPLRPRAVPPLRTPARRGIPARRRARAAALAVLLAAAGATAQGQPHYSLESTLRYYHKHASGDEAARARPVSKLGDYEGPEVTRILIEEVRRARTPSFARTAVRALGRRARPGALEVLADRLQHAGSDFALRNLAAAGLAAQGEAGVRLLIERLEALPADRDPGQRSEFLSLVAGLGHSDSAPARAALVAAAGAGTERDRLAALRALADAPAEAAVTAVRTEASRSTDLALAAEGASQLAVHGDGGARQRLLQVHGKARHSDDGRVHASLLEGLAAVLDGDDTYRALLEDAAHVDPDVDDAFARIAARVADDGRLAAWLLAKGLRQGSPRQRAVAIRLLAGDRDQAVTDALLALVKAREPAVFTAAIEVLATRRDDDVLAALRALVDSGAPAQRACAMRALHGLLHDDPAWRAKLEQLLAGRDLSQRMLAMDLLADLGDRDVLPAVRGDLDHASWQVRAAAYAYLAKVRAADSIPPLIERVDAESGRLQQDVLDALQALTRLRLPTGERWRAWWKEQRDGYRLPPPLERPTRRRGPATTVTYYDLPVDSKRAVFLLDVSGSMSLPFGTSHRTRLQEAQRQLHRVIDTCDRDFRFNLVFFGTRVQAVWRELTAADDRARKKAGKAVDACVAKGGTNIHGALERAFADPDVDTIFLLSDGYPSAGEIRDPDALAELVAGWNAARRIRIHTIAVGSRSPLLRRLAEESGGRYTRVR